MTGIPISFKSLRHSSLCAFVGFTCLLANLSISSAVPDHATWVRDCGRMRVRIEKVGKHVPVSFASSSASAAALRAANRLASCAAAIPRSGMAADGERCTYDTAFQLRRFAIKHVRWLDSVIHHSQSSPEEAHEMTVEWVKISGRSSN